MAEILEGERVKNGTYGILTPELVLDSDRGKSRASRAKYKVTLPSGYIVYFGDTRYEHFKGAGAGSKDYDTFGDEKRRVNAIQRMGVQMKKNQLRIYDSRDPVYWSARYLYGFDSQKDAPIVSAAIERKNARKIKPKVVIPEAPQEMIGSGAIQTKEVKLLEFETYPKIHEYDQARIVIVGDSGSGKTTLMTSEFLCNTDDPPYRWSALFVFASMANDDDLYKALQKLKPRNAEGKKIPVAIMTDLNLKKLDRSIVENSLVIIDDFSGEITRHKDFYQLLTTIRHKKSTAVLCCHDFTNIEKKARQNVSYWFFTVMGGDRLKEVVGNFLSRASEEEIRTLSTLQKHEWVAIRENHIVCKFVKSEQLPLRIDEKGNLYRQEEPVANVEVVNE